MPRIILTLLTFIAFLATGDLRGFQNLAGLVTPTAHAAEPPTAPILRIETGMHTAGIRRIDVDRSGRWLVSASDDKSVRVWDLETGYQKLETGKSMQPSRILRPPIGEGNEGKLYSVAISPDGNLVAAGSEGNIYLFSRHDGRLLGNYAITYNSNYHLTFSPDGRYLLATLYKGGVMLFVVDDAVGATGRSPLRLIAQDTTYDNQSYGAHFSPDGSRLVTSCWDGYVRVYETGSWVKGQGSRVETIKPIARQKAPGGDKPYSVKFSPDGAKIAVGFDNSTKVNVLSSRDLTLLYTPDSGGVSNGDLGRVAWSADGGTLYAGGMATINGALGYIRRWSDAGRGGYSDLKSGATNTIMDLVPMPGGGVAFGAYDPAISVLPGAGVGATGRSPLLIPPGVADYRDNHDGFQISQDGTTVKFGYLTWGKEPATFSITNRTLSPILNSQLSILNLSPPDTTSLSINNWKYTTNPTFNNQPLKLDQYEMSRSLSIAPDRGSFLLGTEWYLRRFDKTGSEQWNVSVPGVAWAVNIAQNGSIAVAAFGDGTIRWYRYSDGKELAAFFPHADKKRWVVWTPSGYYDASSGGDELIGWHVNKGKDREADFFPAARFRSTYYRPDVIGKILDTLDEGEALRLANSEAGRKSTPAPSIASILPPVVSIVSPDDGANVSTGEITLRFRVRSPSGDPVTAVRALVDGRPVETSRGLKVVAKDGSEQSLTVTIPRRDCEVAIIAENRNAASEPARVRLSWGGKKEDEFTIQPRLYLLAVGVSSYRDKELILKYAAKDARDFAAAMQKQKGGLYRDVAVRLLADEKATKDEILDGLEWIQKETTAKDVAMIFIAGHGVNDPSGIFYYLPQNADPDKLKRTGVAFSDIKNTIASLAGKALLFVDTCHSGNVMGTRRGGMDITAVVNELSSAENGAVVFASSTGRQYSLEDAKWGNGAFTKALVEGVGGKADYGGKGRITVNMLDLWLSERVKELTGGKQTPTTTKPQTIQDFPLAMKM